LAGVAGEQPPSAEYLFHFEPEQFVVGIERLRQTETRLPYIVQGGLP
jgi:hypothetical protein